MIICFWLPYIDTALGYAPSINVITLKLIIRLDFGRRSGT